MVNEKKNIKEILPLMGFEHFEYVLLTNRSGAIVVWNNGKTHASTLLKESRAIQMLTYDPKKHNTLLF